MFDDGSGRADAPSAARPCSRYDLLLGRVDVRVEHVERQAAGNTTAQLEVIKQIILQLAPQANLL